MNTKTKKLTTIAMLCAIAYIVMLVGRIPIVLFLKYEPKDVIITIGGFIYGPLSAFLISLIVSFVEMITASGTGFIGFVMNVISSCAFAATASLIYKRNHTLKGAVIGLFCGVVLSTVLMLLWNYFLTPLYMGQPKEVVSAMLLPVFLPFNLIKGTLNAAITLLIYKPVVTMLRRTNLLPTLPAHNKPKLNVITFLSSLFLIICVIMAVILFNEML